MYLRCCSEYSSSCWTTNVTISKQWFSNFFSSWDTLLQVYFLVDHCPPRALYHPDFPLLYSSALLSPSLVPAPSCKLPRSLFLTPLVIFSPRSLWLLAVDYSKWLGGPSISTACGDFAMGLEGWGRMAGAWGGQCWRANGLGWGWRILSVDHHLGPGGLWWSTGSIWEPLISWKNRTYET